MNTFSYTLFNKKASLKWWAHLPILPIWLLLFPFAMMSTKVSYNNSMAFNTLTRSIRSIFAIVFGLPALLMIFIGFIYNTIVGFIIPPAKG